MKLLCTAVFTLAIATASFADDLDCVCDSVYAVGDQVVTVVDNPFGSTNLPAGSVGTVICGTPVLNLLVIEFDNWDDGFTGDASCTCGDELGPGDNHWYVFCTNVELLPTIITVDDDGKADFDNIQDAINAASNGDEIIVASGTYTSTASEVIDMHGKEIWLHSSDGPETTIIDGEDLRRGIVCVTDESSATIIEGFTITRGYTEEGGGGMYNYESSPTLENCIFTNNTANYGGGMYNVSSSSPTLTNCTFSSNSGSGMYNSLSSPTLTNCTFSSNWGSGMMNNNSSATLTNCTFTGNMGGEEGGGMRNINGSSPTLTNCTFTDNTAYDYGGGMYNSVSSPTLYNCTFTDNITYIGLGGGMYSRYRSPKLIDCTFENNYAAFGGGGMYIYDSITILIDCKFTGNWTHSNYGVGGGIYIYEHYGSNLKLTDTIVCGNFPDQILGDWTDNGGNTVADECECIGDLDTDGDVDIDDLLILISEWGICSGGAPTGACCLNLNNCVDDLTEAQCVAYGGKYLGDMSMCMNDSCSSEAGDFCETARVIYPGAIWFDTSTATDSGFGDPDETQCGGTYLDWDGSPDRWMIYTATGNGTITVDTCDSDSYDTSLVIYEGSDCGGLDQVACNGDSAIPQGCQSDVSSIEMLPVSAGMNYYVRVGGWRAATGTGTVNLIFDGTGTVGACCIGSDCSILSESDCVTSGGTYNGAGSDCGSVFCETPCEGDMNGDGEVDIDDLLIFLGSWEDCE